MQNSTFLLQFRKQLCKLFIRHLHVNTCTQRDSKPSSQLMFQLKIIKIVNKNWDEDTKHVTRRETDEAYTKLFSSVDDVIEEWIARTIMFWETQVFFLLSGLPGNLQIPIEQKLYDQQKTDTNLLMERCPHLESWSQLTQLCFKDGNSTQLILFDDHV